LEAINNLGGAQDATLARPTAPAFLKSPATEGISYQSADVTGETDSYGQFTYQVSQDVTFSVGAVALGTITSTVAARGVVTPLDLVVSDSAGPTTITNSTVLNITRFLMMLDQDGDPSNGIVISPEVREVASTWNQVDFSSSNFEEQLTDIISSAASVDGTPHDLPDAAAAQAHLRNTLTCLYSGAFQGQIGGDATGYFAFTVSPESRSLGGFVFSPATAAGRLRTLVATDQLDFTQAQLSLVGFDLDSVSSYQYTVRYNGLNQVTGTWFPSSTTGTGQGGTPGNLSGGRLTPATLTVNYRATGTFNGSYAGAWVLDIPPLPQTGTVRVLGRMYTVNLDSSLTLNGEISPNGNLSITGEDGSTRFDGNIDLTTLHIIGTWSNDFADPRVSGTYTGAACRLL
jgi:hypothetical protein